MQESLKELKIKSLFNRYRNWCFSCWLFLIRDAHMDGSKITFLEQLDIPGGSLDGEVRQNMDYVARGGREMGHHLRFYGVYLVHYHLQKTLI